jgi:hypothetical protein
MKLHGLFSASGGYMFAKRYVSFCLIAFFLLIYPLGYSSAQSPDEIKKELIKKGFSEEVINILNPRAQAKLNSKVPAGVVWYATFDREAKSITVDFQTEEKTHNSITVVSLANGGCMTVQNTIMMSIGTTKIEAERWIALYKKHGVKLKIEEESQQRVYLSAEGNLGVKVYLYPMGNLCMQVFRNVETIK